MIPLDELKVTRARSSLYAFLARLYGIEPDLNFMRQIREPGFVQAFSDLGIEFEEGFLKKPEKEFLNEMNIEYTRLFIGPGKHISPYESVHRDEEGLLMGDSTVKVKAFIKAAGLNYRSDYTGLPDHISVEFEFMYRLVEAETEAREKNEKAKLKKIQDIERRFVDEHISKWIPQFADKIVKETRLDFYRKIAVLTKEFGLLETKELNLS